MFVRSRVSKPLVYRKGGRSWIINPNSVTLIDDPTITAKEIKGCYGSRVDVIADEGAYIGSFESRQSIKNVLKSKVEEPVKKFETPKKAGEESLDDILDQVNKELGELTKNEEKSDEGEPKSDNSEDNNTENSENTPNGDDSRDSDDSVPEGEDAEDDKTSDDVSEDDTEDKEESDKPVKKKTTRRRSTKRTSKKQAK